MIEILVVEDEQSIRDLLKMNLVSAGYQVTTAEDGLVAANLLEERDFDLILLDIMLPKIDGYELFEYIKPLHIPVIFLTAKAALDDRVKGLMLGAEDYIIKPFEIVELLARVNVVLRRYQKSETTLTFADLSLDTENRLVKKAGTFLDLTPKELDLLELFMRNVNITLFRERIFEQIWNQEYMGDSRTLDLHIQRLRKKTGLGDQLKTIYRVGYRLEKTE